MDFGPHCRGVVNIKTAIDLANQIFPRELYGRAADNWRSLLSIADVAGDVWPQRARQAAVTLSANISEQTAGIMVLLDLQKVLNESRDRLSTVEILASLNVMEDRPWPEWNRGKPLSPTGLAPSVRAMAARRRAI